MPALIISHLGFHEASARCPNRLVLFTVAVLTQAVLVAPACLCSTGGTGSKPNQLEWEQSRECGLPGRDETCSEHTGKNHGRSQLDGPKGM